MEETSYMSKYQPVNFQDADSKSTEEELEDAFKPSHGWLVHIYLLWDTTAVEYVSRFVAHIANEDYVPQKVFNGLN